MIWFFLILEKVWEDEGTKKHYLNWDQVTGSNHVCCICYAGLEIHYYYYYWFNSAKHGYQVKSKYGLI